MTPYCSGRNSISCENSAEMVTVLILQSSCYWSQLSAKPEDEGASKGTASMGNRKLVQKGSTTQESSNVTK